MLPLHHYAIAFPVILPYPQYGDLTLRQRTLDYVYRSIHPIGPKVPISKGLLLMDAISEINCPTPDGQCVTVTGIHHLH